MLETEEESGSHDLVYLLKKNHEIIKTPDICFCMDSGCLDYNNIWLTSTLRGICELNLTVEIASMGTHSGTGGGILPDSYRILNILISRLENLHTGEVIKELQAKEIPDYFREEAKFIADLLGPKLCDLHMLEGVVPLSHDNYAEMYLNNTWRAWLTLTGIVAVT